MNLKQQQTQSGLKSLYAFRPQTAYNFANLVGTHCMYCSHMSSRGMIDLMRQLYVLLSVFTIWNWDSGGSLVRPKVRVLWNRKSGSRPTRVPKMPPGLSKQCPTSHLFWDTQKLWSHFQHITWILVGIFEPSIVSNIASMFLVKSRCDLPFKSRKLDNFLRFGSRFDMLLGYCLSLLYPRDHPVYYARTMQRFSRHVPHVTSNLAPETDPDYCSNLASLWDYVHNQKCVVFVCGCTTFWGDLLPNISCGLDLGQKQTSWAPVGQWPLYSYAKPWLSRPIFLGVISGQT